MIVETHFITEKSDYFLFELDIQLIKDVKLFNLDILYLKISLKFF
jgi:hypothetical protein